MATPKDASPAVQSLKREQSRQRSKSAKDDLEKGLEGTFPASDPVSVTRTSVPAGRVDKQEAETVKKHSDPSAGNTLLGDKTKAAAQTPDRGDGVRKLKSQAAKVSTSLPEITHGSVSMAKAQGSSVLSDIGRHVKERPLTAVGIVAAIAFVFGVTR